MYEKSWFSVSEIDTMTPAKTYVFEKRDNTAAHYLFLYVKPISYTTLADTIILGDIYQNYGFYVDTIVNAGHYTLYDTLSNSVGCDSLVFIQLVVLQPDTLYDSICFNTVSYIGNGFGILNTDTLSADSFYEYNRVENDTFYVLNLYVKSLSDTTLYDTIVRGNIYFKNGFDIATADSVCGLYTYYKTETSFLDCDSIVTLNLVVLQPDTLRDSLCYGTPNYSAKGFDIGETHFLEPFASYEYQRIGGDTLYTLYLYVQNSPNCTLFDTICRGDYYSSYGFNINSSEIYYNQYDDYQIVETGSGCDSMVILHLFVKQPTITDIFDTSCNSYFWSLRNETYSLSGIYSDTLTNAAGCDSIVNLHLTIYYSSYFEDSVIICPNEIYSWHGQDLNAEGLYYDSLVSFHLCDSVYRIAVSVAPSYYYDGFDTICDGDTIEWHGMKLFAAGLYYDSLQTLGTGCDSVYALALTVNLNKTTIFSESVVYGAIYNKYGFSIWTDTLAVSVTHQFYQNLQTVNGCDSTVVLRLFVEPPYVTVWRDTVCSNEGYYNVPFSIVTDSFAAGTYGFTETVHTIDGDSTFVLTLTVLPLPDTTFISGEICSGGVYVDLENSFLVRTVDSLPGTYKYSRVIPAGNGCDSVITLVLTVNQPVETHVYDTVVYGTNYYGFGFNELSDTLAVGDYSFEGHHYAAEGCDSVVYLHLHINRTPVVEHIYDTICSGFGYYAGYDFGFSVTGVEPGEYIHTHVSGDSTTILHLTVRGAATVVVYDSVCKGEIYYKGGFFFRTDTMAVGTHIASVQSVTAAGCDSVTILYLKINEPKNVALSDTVVVGTFYTASGFEIATDTLQPLETHIFTNYLTTISGCDSVVELSLYLLSPVNIVIKDSICYHEEYQTSLFNLDTRHYMAGVYHFSTIVNSIYGDTIYNLSLTVLPLKNTVYHYETICHCGVYTDNDFIVRTCDSIQGTYSYYRHYSDQNGCDSVVCLRLTVSDEITVDIYDTIENGASYAANGFITKTDTLAAGDYTFSQLGYTKLGCDSVTILHIHVKRVPPVVDLFDTICRGFGSYMNFDFNLNVTGLASGDYVYSHKQDDSTTVLHLTVDEPLVANVYDTVCKGIYYYKYGFTVNTDTLSVGHFFTSRQIVNNNGCDSIVNLWLTVNKVDTTVLNVTLCRNEQYVGYGFTLTSNETQNVGARKYERTLQNKSGCDSTVILQVRVGATDTVFISDAVCHGATYCDYGFVIHTADSVAGSYTYLRTITNSIGCDSTVILSLTVDWPIQVVYNETAIIGDLYIGHGFVVATDTLDFGLHSYSHKYYTMSGCDSTVVLDLFVKDSMPVVYMFDTICHGVGTYINFPFSIQNNNNPSGTSFYTQTVNDTIYNLYLTVNKPIKTVFYDYICEDETVYDNAENGFAFSTKNLTIGTYTYTHLSYVNNNGCDCDSTSELYLTVTGVKDIAIFDTICMGRSYSSFGFDIPAGELSTAGDYTYIHELLTKYGCDSVTTLHLTVTPASVSVFYDDICRGEVYIGHEFAIKTTDSVQGNYQYVRYLQTKNGCDSIAVLNLTVNEGVNVSYTDTICYGEVYSQHGFNASASGVYVQNLKTVSGCDSIVTLNLFVNPTPVTTIVDNVCQNEAYYQYDFSISGLKNRIPGTYTYQKSLQTEYGCDSIVILNLTVNPNRSLTLYDEVCHGEVYIGMGFAIRTKDSLPNVYTYVQNLQTSNGCDSVIILKLTVKHVP
ncbi:MAG: hypothetical protein J6W84_08315, partial [Bacteroidales bacterium]|nr:hypothetical protein [Bacteroidales bacterium]